MGAGVRPRPKPARRVLPGHFNGRGVPKIGYDTKEQAWAVEETAGVYECDFCGKFHRTTHEPEAFAESRL
jgi:hypothetical protein